MKQFAKTLAALIGVAVVYFYSGKLGLALALGNASATAFWPPTGLALAALLLGGNRLWPGIFLGAFLVHFTAPGSWGTTFGIAAGNTLEALIAAELVRLFANGVNCFERARMTFRFILLAGMLSTLVGATIGVTSLSLGHDAEGNQRGILWTTWWIGGMTSNLVMAPLLIVWLGRRLPRGNLLRLVEGGGLALALALTGAIVFLGGNPFTATEQMEYLSILPLLWAAFRFGPRGAIAATFIVAAMAWWGTWHGRGPFLTPDPKETLLRLQAFTVIIAATVLVMAAVVAERQRFQAHLEMKNAISRILAEATDLNEATQKVLQTICERAGWDLGVMWQVDRAANLLFCSGLWQSAALKNPAFETVTRQIRFAPGSGLPGRVWLHGKAEWIPDVAEEDDFPRAPAAARAGLHAAFCFPLRLGNGTLGVMECFRREVCAPDAEFIQLLVPLGHQLGLFIERRQVEFDLALLVHGIESTGEMICMTDLQDRFIFTNPAFRETLGYTTKEIIGQTPALIHSPNNPPHLLPQILGQSHAGGWSGEVLNVRKNGTEFPIFLRTSQIKDPSGKVIALMGMADDITGRKQALVESEARIKLIMELLEISVNERRRIGHDLHDGLGQHLAGTAFLAKVLEETLTAESSAHAGEASKIVGLINEGISQTRTLAQGLDPVDLEVAGLPAALQKLAGQTAAQFHLTCHFNCLAERLHLPSSLGLALFRIAQESIHNAVRHGKASQISLDLAAANDRISLTIRDNGAGFRVQDNVASGMGLRIMRYRAGSIGGSLAVHSQVNAGTEVVCTVPQQTSLI